MINPAVLSWVFKAQRQRYHGTMCRVVKDPYGMHYFRFQEEEYAILQLLDGRRSVEQIRDEFETQFPPQKITLEELQRFIGMLHRSGLLVAGPTSRNPPP